MQLYSEAGKLAIRDFVRMVKSHFMEAVVAQYNAIFRFPVFTLCHRYARNGIGFSQTDVLTALGTPSTLPVYLVLPESCVVGGSPSEGHVVEPPEYTWVKDPYWWRYYCNGEFTGIAIDPITELKITPYRTIKLEKPSYRVIFGPPNDKRTYHLVESPTLKGAKRLAEWYYSRWVSVNRNVDHGNRTVLPLAKRSGRVAWMTKTESSLNLRGGL